MWDRLLRGSFTTVHRRTYVVTKLLQTSLEKTLSQQPSRLRSYNSKQALTNICLYLVVHIVVPTRVGHQWRHHCGCFIHMKLLQGGVLWLEGCLPAA